MIKGNTPIEQLGDAIDNGELDGPDAVYVDGPDAVYVCDSCGNTQTFAMLIGSPLMELPCKCGKRMRLKDGGKP